MRINLLAVGKRMPAWINQGVAAYVRRLPPHLGGPRVGEPRHGDAGERSARCALLLLKGPPLHLVGDQCVETARTRTRAEAGHRASLPWAPDPPSTVCAVLPMCVS